MKYNGPIEKFSLQIWFSTANQSLLRGDFRVAERYFDEILRSCVYYDTVLDTDVMLYDAYVGKLCAMRQVTNFKRFGVYCDFSDHDGFAGARYAYEFNRKLEILLDDKMYDDAIAAATPKDAKKLISLRQKLFAELYAARCMLAEKAIFLFHTFFDNSYAAEDVYLACNFIVTVINDVTNTDYLKAYEYMLCYDVGEERLDDISELIDIFDDEVMFRLLDSEIYDEIHGRILGDYKFMRCASTDAYAREFQGKMVYLDKTLNERIVSYQEDLKQARADIVNAREEFKESHRAETDDAARSIREYTASSGYKYFGTVTIKPAIAFYLVLIGSIVAMVAWSARYVTYLVIGLVMLLGGLVYIPAVLVLNKILDIANARCRREYEDSVKIINECKETIKVYDQAVKNFDKQIDDINQKIQSF